MFTIGVRMSDSNEIPPFDEIRLADVGYAVGGVHEGHPFWGATVADAIDGTLIDEVIKFEAGESEG